MKDYYYILGINNFASGQEVKQAYRKLSLKFHPDKNDGDKYFEERFKEIQTAYEILSNKEKRTRYDRDWQSYQNQRNSDWRQKEEELRRREEELRRKEEELRKKYQTPEEKEREEREKEEARKKAEKRKLLRQLVVLQKELDKKNSSLEQLKASEQVLNKDIEALALKISAIESALGEQKSKQSYRKSSKSGANHEEKKYKITRAKSGLFGYLDEYGNITISCKFDDAFPFHEGLAAVIYKGKRGYIDSYGDFIIPPIYDREGGSYFKDGVAKVQLDGRELVIDRDGRVVFR